MIVECDFPLGVRLWRWWCENGPKNASGGSIGGSFLHRRLRDLYSFRSKDMPVYGRVRIKKEHYLYLSAIDLRTYQMVLPQLREDDNEVLLAKVITPHLGVFVDVGANIGALSFFALAETAGAVYSFEPNPSMMALMDRTRSEHPFADRWFLRQLAVGATKGELRLFIEQNFSGTASFVETWQKAQNEPTKVDVTTLDDWFREEKPESMDVLKMDVEGWEAEVLKGAHSTIGENEPYIWFEHNLPALKRAHMDGYKVLDELQELGYSTFFDIGNLPDQIPLSIEKIAREENRRLNLLAVPRQRADDFSTRVIPRFDEERSD